MTKQVSALVAAMATTACIIIAILIVGGAALFNPNGVAAAQSPAQAAQAMSSDAGGTQVQQLQALVAQYQSRETQYQAREQQYQQQLDAASSQVQQAQEQMREIRSLLSVLQQRGIISITADGQIVINR